MKNKLTKEMIGMEKISPSALMTYLECPRLFYYRYWLGLKIPDTDKRHLAFGTAFHSALENIYNQYDDNFKSGWEYAEVGVAIDTFEEHFKINMITDEEWERVRKQKTNKHQSKQELFNYMLKNGKDMIRHYWKEKEYLLTEYGIDVIESEIPMNIKMCNPSNPEEYLPIPLSLRIDALTRKKKKIVEFKTSAGLYNEKETREKIQGRAYVFAMLMTEKEIKPVDYIVCLKDKRENQVIHLNYDMADMQKFYHEIESILQKIANREFGYGKVAGFNRRDVEAYDRALGLKS